MTKIINGVPTAIGVGEVLNNLPSNVQPTKASEQNVQDGRLVIDIRDTNPGVKI